MDVDKESAIGAGIGAAVGATGGVLGNIAGLSSAGVVSGLSAAGMTSGLAATGAGGMLGGIVTLSVVPLGCAVAVGIIGYTGAQWHKKRRRQKRDEESD